MKMSKLLPEYFTSYHVHFNLCVCNCNICDLLTQRFKPKCFCNIRQRAEEPTRATTTEEPGQSSSFSFTKYKSRETEEEKDKAHPSTSKAGNQDEDGENGEKKNEEEKGEVVEAVLTEEDLIQQSQAEYDSGRYSPTLLTSSELPLDSHTIAPEEDMHRLQLARRQLQVTGMRLLTHTKSFKVSVKIIV